jgi:hypothetical protein
MMFFFHLPRFSPVMGLLPAPEKRVGLNVIERPTYRRAVDIYTTKNDTIAFRSPLNIDEVVALRGHKDHAPLFESSIEEPNRRANPAILLAICRVGNKDVLHRATIQDPAEQQLALFMSNTAILEKEAIVAISGAHEAIEDARLLA